MKLGKVQALSAVVDAKLSNAFGSLASFITNRPLLTIIGTTILAFALAPGMGIGKTERNGERLWTPQDTESQDQSAWVRSTFGAGERRTRVYSSNDGANLLTRDSLVALEKLHDGILTVTADCDTGSCDGKAVKYEDVHAKQRSSVLSIWGDKAPAAGVDILADMNNEAKWLSTTGSKLKLSDMLGGVQYDSSGKIIGAEAFLTTLWLKNELEAVDSTDADPASEAWELEFDDYVKDFSNSALKTNYPWSTKGQSDAGGTAIKDDVKLLSFGYMFLIIFSVLVLSSHKRVQSNGVMALVSVLSVGLSIVSTFGLCGYIGVKQNPVTSTLYLVLLGIGVDDCYVIMGEYSHSKGSPQERVIQALRKAGTSIAVTSMTDMVAFFAGVTSSLPALRDFCIFAAVGIFFDFFYQCTFLVSILYYRARCTADDRPDWSCCFKTDSESTGCCNCSLPVCSRNGQCVCCPCTTENENGEIEGITRKMLNRITKLTLTPIGMGVVAVMTVGLLAGGIAGFPKLNTDFDIQWFTPDDAEYQKVYDLQEKYFPISGGLPVYIFTKEGSYAAAHSDGSLAALYQRVSSCDVIAQTVGNWYTEFVKDAGRSNRGKASDAAFASEVKSFVNSASGARFQKDVSFIESAQGGVTGIQASRAMYIAKETSNGEDDIAMTESVRDCVNDKPLNAFAFSRPFLYFDGLAVVDKETIQNVLIACACVFVVNAIMLADLVAATLVLLMVGLVDVCILGYMAHWDLDFNSVTAINLVLAVGLAVDYSAHIAHSFLVASGSGVDRAKLAVDHIGMSVFNGAFSTFLAVLPLAMSKSYVFTVLFKMWFMIIIFGVYFGVIVLPVILCLASPCVGAQAVEADTSSKVEEVDSTKVAVTSGPQTIGSTSAGA